MKPILPESTIIGDRTKIESRWSRRLQLQIQQAVRWTPAAKVAAKIAVVTRAEIKGLWGQGWRLGMDHGDREFKLISSKSNRAKFAYFSDEDKITNPRAEIAIDDRISQIATSVGSSEWEQMQEFLTSNVKGDLSRKDLTSAISAVLGGERFQARAETIARTELATAYNMGRLQTYRDSGVPGVIFYAILDERTCPICMSRNGRTARMDDWIGMRMLTAPLHVNCRCVVSPMLDDTLVSSVRGLPQMGKREWFTDGILRGIIKD